MVLEENKNYNGKGKKFVGENQPKGGVKEQSWVSYIYFENNV